jgi:ribosomal protein L17
MDNKADHYKREAERLLSLAKQSSFAEVRQELTRLADQYQRLADSLALPYRQTG